MSDVERPEKRKSERLWYRVEIKNSWDMWVMRSDDLEWREAWEDAQLVSRSRSVRIVHVNAVFTEETVWSAEGS